MCHAWTRRTAHQLRLPLVPSVAALQRRIPPRWQSAAFQPQSVSPTPQTAAAGNARSLRPCGAPVLLVRPIAARAHPSVPAHRWMLRNAPNAAPPTAEIAAPPVPTASYDDFDVLPAAVAPLLPLQLVLLLLSPRARGALGAGAPAVPANSSQRLPVSPCAPGFPSAPGAGAAPLPSSPPPAQRSSGAAPRNAVVSRPDLREAPVKRPRRQKKQLDELGAAGSPAAGAANSPEGAGNLPPVVWRPSSRRSQGLGFQRAQSLQEGPVPPVPPQLVDQAPATHLLLKQVKPPRRVGLMA
mmetsp:Transcript_17250/g.38172  ORF Transcript_17250/g.38172 Transcript_17250/m.38172 type:complete len:297 (+) Transcript_17250:288-1178(+)